MKHSIVPRHPLQLTSAKRRGQLLAQYDRSGLSAARFAREHGLAYTTFCGWVQRRRRARLKVREREKVGFAQVEMPAPVPPTELLVEIGHQVRLSIHSAEQLKLAAALIQSLNAATAC